MEQRKNPRFPVRFRSSFTSLNIVGGDGNITDLSLRGCRVESQTEVRQGTSLELRIHSSEDEPPLKIQEAVVRWSRGQQFGVEFITLDPEEWARLQHTVTHLELQPYEKVSKEPPSKKLDPHPDPH
jgi:PilZ domain